MHNWMKYAAALTALVFIGTGVGVWLQQHKSAQEMLVAVANEGMVKEVVLPDGSKVWLNNAAVLQYPREFSGNRRNVHLEGEAYFEVTKDRQRPFTVESDAMRVRVLGTSFNFKCDFSGNRRNVHLEGEAYFEVTKDRQRPFTVESDAMRVRVLGTSFNFKCDRHCWIAEATLIEGEIEVKGNKEEGMVILAPGQRAELNKSSGRLTVKQVDAKMDAVWHDNLIPFQKADIFTISKALERFYNVKIILSPDIQLDKTYSGVLKRKSDIGSVLKSLQNSIPINYKIIEGNIFISSK